MMQCKSKRKTKNQGKAIPETFVWDLSKETIRDTRFTLPSHYGYIWHKTSAWSVFIGESAFFVHNELEQIIVARRFMSRKSLFLVGGTSMDCLCWLPCLEKESKELTMSTFRLSWKELSIFLLL
jgi:hypothetical protein